MISCRSIPEETWEHARKALIYYFSRRHGRDTAEDLAQETLAELLKRDDYLFAAPEDFLRVCHAFAGNVLQAARRKEYRNQAVELDPDLTRGEENVFGLNPTEMTILRREAFEAKGKLSAKDRQTIDDYTNGKPRGGDPRLANRFRVGFFRAKKRFGRLLNGE